VIVAQGRGRDMSALLVACKGIPENYDYVCFVHDKKTYWMGNRHSTEAFCDLMWENTLYSREYVENILDLFESHP